MDGIRRFAEHVVTTTYEHLPPTAVLATKTFILDSIGVGVAGSADPSAARIAECAAGWGKGDESTVWGSGERLPAQAAALVNAYQIHCLEFDCVHEGAVVHPMATLLSALVAGAERRGKVSGRDLLTAVAVGVDVACSIGMASRAPITFFRPATAGAFGAVAALGKLEGFGVESLTHAFGIVYGQICGTLQPHIEGSSLLGMQIGFNARGALTAVDLAARGLTGPLEVLEGRYGYFKLFESGAYDLAPVLATLGRVWQVTRLAHKPFPSGRASHGVVDGLTRLQARYRFGPAGVAKVRATVPPLVRRLVGRPDVPAPSANYAKLCLPFVAATALLRGTVDVPDFLGDRLTDPELHALAQRVEIVGDENPDENALVPQTIQVTLVDGRRPEIRLDSVLGHPDAPLSREQHLGKFRRCWTYGRHRLSEANGERLIALVDRLEAVSDVRDLVALTVP
ncbi:MAG: MmgE/PrpD family protein [Candidatus Rokubacteria bacterium]|nr:MmgE/PrpD family protein [Candidatus Rokubacteria bacterium]